MNYLQKKKLAFMSIVNKVKGFVKTIIGIPPLTLPNCVDEDSLIGYKIYGDSVQDGTPSPDAPVEIESVGVKTKNLLDISTAENKTVNDVELSVDYVTQKIKAKGVATANGGRLFYLAQVTLPAGTYYFSSNTELPRAGLTNVNSTSSVVAWCNRKFTLTETTTLGLGFNIVANTEYDAEILLQITEGTTPTDYEPFGYKIPVKAKGKNMVKPVDGTYGKNKTGATVKDRQIIIHNIEPVNAGSTFNAYTIPCEFIQGEIGKTYVMCWGNGVKISDKGHSTLRIEFEDGTTKTLYGNWGASNRIKFTLTSLIKKVLITIAVVDTGIYLETPFTIQLEEGEVVSDYEPYVEPITTNIYLDEPLSKGQAISYPNDNIPKLPTFKGTTIYEVDTNIQPSNMEVSYYSSRKGE